MENYWSNIGLHWEKLGVQLWLDKQKRFTKILQTNPEKKEIDDLK